MTYQEYLATPMWQKLRLEILTRDNWTCRVCGDNDMLHQKQIHHCFYDGKPWEIDPFWLVTVCVPCHKKLEADKGKPLELSDEDYERMYQTFNANRNGYRDCSASFFEQLVSDFINFFRR